MTAKKVIVFSTAFCLGLLLAVSSCRGEDFGTDYNKAMSQGDGKNVIVVVGATW